MIIKNGHVFSEEGRFQMGDVFIEQDKIATGGSGEVLDATGLYPKAPPRQTAISSTRS